MSENQSYILGTDKTELERLGFQHRVWSSDAARLWERGRVQRGMHILDLGAGPGFATFDLAEIVGPSGQVTAIDISQDYVDYGNAQATLRGYDHVRFYPRSIHHLQLEPEQFDVVYCRWVLSWVNDVDLIITEIAKLLKPGGVFLVQEYAQWGTFRIIPELPEVRTMIEACRESWRVMPSEIDIAPRLPEMFYQNGLKMEHKAMLEKVAAPNELVWQWPGTFLHIYSEKLIEMNLLTKDQQQAFIDAWPSLESNPSGMIITPLMMEFAARKG
jgi:ubiquinone/menaquinone biosynthesis C-methylase UbiE